MRVELSTATLEVHERPGASGVTVVFLHYFGGSGRTWEPVMDALAPDAHRLIAPDLRGFGGSDAPGEDWAHYTVDTMADDVHGLLGRLEIGGPCIVVGHSMGAKVALALASHQPAALRGLVLVAPSPPTPEPMAPAERARMLAGHGKAEAARETLSKITAGPLPPAGFDLALADQLRPSAPAWRAWLEHGSREDVSAGMANVTVPVSVAVGAEDENITVALVEREIIARSRHARTPVAVIPGAAHLVPLEAPAAVAELVRAAVRGNAAQTGR